MNKNELANQLSSETDINAIRNAVVSQEFENNQNNRALILIAPFPFLVIGKIIEVVSDFVVIDAEVTNVSELDDEKFRIHMDDIEVFYIEKEGRAIPDIRAGNDD